MIPKGSKVRLRTDNGGDTVVWLVTDYHSTYGADFAHHEHHIDADARWHFRVPGWRITSVEVVE